MGEMRSISVVKDFYLFVSWIATLFHDVGIERPASSYLLLLFGEVISQFEVATFSHPETAGARPQ
jgi:hypothetical protein